MEKSEFKRAWNALTYGSSKMGINRICKNIDADVIYKYFTGIKEFKQYKKRCKDLADRNINHIETYFGTTVYGDSIGAGLKRQLMDLPIQGTGSDILALLVEHFDEEVSARELDEYMDIYYTRHDEIIVEVDSYIMDNYSNEEVITTLRDIFEHQVDDWEPFMVKIEKVEHRNADEIAQAYREADFDE